MIFSKLIKKESDVLTLIKTATKMHSQVSSGLLLTYLNQHCFNIYNENSKYQTLLDKNFTVFLDGFGVYAALKFLNYKNVEKFNATDLYEKIFQQFSAKQTKLFLIGSSFSNHFIKGKAEENKLNICKYHSGYFSEDELTGIIECIKKKSPEAIVIGMGVPTQEVLAENILNSIKEIPILCVGGFFEFYFGTKKRAPLFFRKMRIEWIHRLLSEPGRLWKRYLLGIPKFLFFILKHKFRMK
jgi:N-acetylglucosaminyldiphosphoundecaprenol N-acetyl-beta-D-mannosaminyltransferase